MEGNLVDTKHYEILWVYGGGEGGGGERGGIAMKCLPA